jgi:very-short-patch-repair endonuclease
LVRRGVYATRKSVQWSKRDKAREHAIRAFAATLVLRGAVVSHHSAARIHGFDLYQPPDEEIVSLTLPPRSRGLAREHERMIRYRAVVSEVDRAAVLGVWVTSAARTVLDVARGSKFMHGVVIADSALRMKKTSDRELRRMLVACSGWPGSEMARQVVEFADGRSESVLESCARVVFHERRLEPPDLQVWIPHSNYRADFLWAGDKVIAECDGLAKYEEDPKKKIAEQIRRDNVLRRLGYEVIHFTWDDLFNRPDKVIQDILDAMRRQRELATAKRKRLHGGHG